MGEGREKYVRKLAEEEEIGGGREEEAGKVEVAPGVTVLSLMRRFRAALIGTTQGLPKRGRVRHLGSLRSLRVRCCRYMLLSRGASDAWLAAGDKSPLT